MEEELVRALVGRSRRRRAASRVVLYLTRGDPRCECVARLLSSAGVPFVRTDLLTREQAMREYASKTRGRVRLPAVRIGDDLFDSLSPRDLKALLRRKRLRKE